MSRIGTFGASQMYLSRLSAIQQRLHTANLQVNTEKKSVNYTGIATVSNRLVNLENEKSRAKQFVEDNGQASTRLKAAQVSMDAMEKSLKDVKKRLDDYASKMSTNQQDIEQLQDWAFNAMVDLQSYLAANVDGQYIFSGGRVNNEPVELPAGSLQDFQAIYDGASKVYPTTREAHMADFETTNAQTGNISFNGGAGGGTISAASLTTAPNALSTIPVGSRITVEDSAAGVNNGKSFTVRGVTVNGTGTHLDVSPLTAEGPVAGTVSFKNAAGVTQSVSTNLTFVPGTDQITTVASSGLTAGTVFTVSGTASNDGVYTVGSVVAGPPDTVTISGTKVTTQAASATISLKAEGWYKGDTLQLQHRVDVDRMIDVGIYASDPAFEKAFRALGMIAQGGYGTAGGLENNMSRIDEARFLLQDAINRNGSGIGPSGNAEDIGDLEGLQAKVGVTQNLIKIKNEKHTQYSGFLEMRIIDLENVDKTEAVAKLLDEQTALQTSYQTLATVRGLSLLQYLK